MGRDRRVRLPLPRNGGGVVTGAQKAALLFVATFLFGVYVGATSALLIR